MRPFPAASSALSTSRASFAEPAMLPGAYAARRIAMKLPAPTAFAVRRRESAPASFDPLLRLRCVVATRRGRRPDCAAGTPARRRVAKPVPLRRPRRGQLGMPAATSGWSWATSVRNSSTRVLHRGALSGRACGSARLTTSGRPWCAGGSGVLRRSGPRRRRASRSQPVWGDERLERVERCDRDAASATAKGDRDPVAPGRGAGGPKVACAGRPPASQLTSTLAGQTTRKWVGPSEREVAIAAIAWMVLPRPISSPRITWRCTSANFAPNA